MRIVVTTQWPPDFDGLRVMQMNARPSRMPEKIISDDVGADGSMIGVWVPCREAGIEAQTDVSSWGNLIRSYGEVFEYAIGHGASKVCMPSLGPTLYWQASKTAFAARTALSALGGSLKDFVVTFVVRKKDARIWLDELACFDARSV